MPLARDRQASGTFYSAGVIQHRRVVCVHDAPEQRPTPELILLDRRPGRPGGNPPRPHRRGGPRAASVRRRNPARAVLARPPAAGHHRERPRPVRHHPVPRHGSRAEADGRGCRGGMPQAPVKRPRRHWHRPAPRRCPGPEARFIAGALACPRRPRAPSGPPGSVQPKATVPRSPRRAAARVLRGGQSSTPAAPARPGPAAPLRPGAAPLPVPCRVARHPARHLHVTAAGVAAVRLAHGFISSRRPVGGLRVGVYTPPLNALPPAGSQPGGLVRRRTAARGAWGGQSTPQPHLPGLGSPAPPLPVPRRAAARALWRSVLGALNASGPTGTVQPRVTVPVPRRTAARVLWHSGAGAANAHGPSGSVQPHLTVARRSAAQGP